MLNFGHLKLFVEHCCYFGWMTFVKPPHTHTLILK